MLEAHELSAIASFHGEPAPGAVDEDLAHQERRDGEEVCATAPGFRPLVGEPEISLVHERGRLQCMVASLLPHIAGSQPMQLIINERQQFCVSVVPSTKLRQQLGDPAATALIVNHSRLLDSVREKGPILTSLD